jgi:hypothetical protein
LLPISTRVFSKPIDRAVQKMRQRCLTKKNYAAAQLNAKEQFGQMLRSMGFKKTRVEIGSK